MFSNCNGMVFCPSSLEDFKKGFAKARKSDGRKIDFLPIHSHSDNETMVFENGYVFSGSQEEIDCLKENLSPNAQVFLLGCNTATPRLDGGLTLTDRLSKGLPGKEVIGFSAFYNRWFTTTSFSNGRFQHENYFPWNLHGLTYPKTAVVKKS